jgi:hypothetical protein
MAKKKEVGMSHLPYDVEAWRDTTLKEEHQLDDLFKVMKKDRRR